MPKVSERKELLREIEQLIEIEMLFNSSDESEWSSSAETDSSSEDDGEDSDIDDLIDLYRVIEFERFMNKPQRFSKSKDFYQNFFTDLPTASFRQMMRMDRSSFGCLLRLVEDHPVFTNKARVKQASVHLQLAVTLDRLGHDGNGACLSRSLFFWGISMGSMVKFTQRVLTAISCKLGGEVRWPSRVERAQISSYFATKGFPGCVGLIDGSLLPLCQRPRYDGETYFDRKSNYSVNAQIVCCHRKKIFFFFAGMPGSCQDVTCLRRSPLIQHIEVDGPLFDSDQYLLGDSGYPPMAHLVSSFRMCTGDREKQDFNTCVAHARVANEHCIGILKSRWFSMKQLRTQLKNRKENSYLVKWVTCCVMLHNFCLTRSDHWTEDDGELVIEQEIPNNGNDILRGSGNALRARVQRVALEYNRSPGGVLFKQ